MARFGGTVFAYIKIIIGAVMAGFSVACILLPNDAIDYGTAGIGIIVSKISGLNLSLSVLIVFAPFMVAGGIYLGRSFLFRALTGAVVYMAGLEVFTVIPFELNIEHFIAVAIGGAILGLGLSLILRSGGCIDGSEILASIIVKKISEKKNRNVGLTGILVIFNALVYLAAFFLIDVEGALLSILVYFVATMVIDHFTDRFEAVKQVTIITHDPGDIVADLREKMNKTCTMIDSRGAIAGENKTIICYVNYFELQKLREILKEYQDSTYITISTIDEIL